VSSARRPDFFIVGAPKSGTTAMYEYLRGHPSLFLPQRKELRFFGTDLEIRDRQPLSREAYEAHFTDASPTQRVGTAYVWYLYSRLAAAEIHAYAPEARIVVMVRNPVDMLHALHAEHLSNGNEDIVDFTAALDAEPDRRRGERIPAHAHLPQGLWYTTVPRYVEQIERYHAQFGRERVHTILYDDFARDVPATYRALLAFLDVRDDWRPPSFDVINASHRTRSERLRHFLARPPELPRRVIRSMVPARVRRSLYERAKRLNAATAAREPMPTATRMRLQDALRDEVDRLSSLLDRDLSGWLEGRQGAIEG
jgi:hypothetical protein